MPGTLLCSEAEQDRLLLRMYELSRRFLRGKVNQDDIEDAVHDIATDCLIKLRTQVWVYAPENVQAFVRKLVKDYVVDRLRRRRSLADREAEHARVREATVPSWMSPDEETGVQSITAWQRRLLAKLSYRCRTAYYMVREERIRYEEVAERLGVSRKTVYNYIAQAQRRMRDPLRSSGLRSSRGLPGSRPRRARRRGNHAPLVPRYPARQTEQTSR